MTVVNRIIIYTIEPTCKEYVINGDLWDYLFDEFVERFGTDRLFLPFTLEMGHGFDCAKTRCISFRNTVCFIRFYRITGREF